MHPLGVISSISILTLAMNSSSVGQMASHGDAPTYEVASVRPCRNDSAADFRGGGGIQSPGRLDLNCQTMKVFILRAYVYFRGGHLNLFRSLLEIDGAPDWIDERYSITAKARGYRLPRGDERSHAAGAS